MLSWNPDDPPAQPPDGCRDAQRWRAVYALYSAHQLEDSGSRCACGEVWPCPSHRRAVRALVTAFMQAGPVMVAQPTNEAAACRWCGRGIAPYGDAWVHLGDGLVVCDYLNADAAVTVAEPSKANRT